MWTPAPLGFRRKSGIAGLRCSGSAQTTTSPTSALWGHDKEKLQKLVGLNSLVCLDVEQHPETIAASVTSDESRIDLRAALAAVAVATAAYLPIAEARGHCVNPVGQSSIFPALLAWALIASLLLNVGQAYDACRARPRRRSNESASVSIFWRAIAMHLHSMH